MKIEREELTFGDAIEALKNGHSVSRAVWKKESLMMWRGNHDFNNKDVPAGITHVQGVPMSLCDPGGSGTVTRFPFIQCTTTHGHNMNGWTPSVIDMLAEDWRDHGPAFEIDEE